MISNITSAIPPPINTDSKVQKVDRTLEMKIGDDGKSQTIVKDSDGEVIRYLPPVSFSDELKMEFDKRNEIDYYI